VRVQMQRPFPLRPSVPLCVCVSVCVCAATASSRQGHRPHRRGRVRVRLQHAQVRRSHTTQYCIVTDHHTQWRQKQKQRALGGRGREPARPSALMADQMFSLCLRLPGAVSGVVRGSCAGVAAPGSTAKELDKELRQIPLRTRSGGRCADRDFREGERSPGSQLDLGW